MSAKVTRKQPDVKEISPVLERNINALIARRRMEEGQKTAQDRVAALNDKCDDLDLQISLLSEHEVTRILQLVVSIADQIGVQEPKAPELDGLVKDVNPEDVLDRLDEQEKRTQ